MDSTQANTDNSYQDLTKNCKQKFQIITIMAKFGIKNVIYLAWQSKKSKVDKNY